MQSMNVHLRIHLWAPKEGPGRELVPCDLFHCAQSSKESLLSWSKGVCLLPILGQILVPSKWYLFYQHAHARFMGQERPTQIPKVGFGDQMRIPWKGSVWSFGIKVNVQQRPMVEKIQMTEHGAFSEESSSSSRASLRFLWNRSTPTLRISFLTLMYSRCQVWSCRTVYPAVLCSCFVFDFFYIYISSLFWNGHVVAVLFYVKIM